MRRPSGRNRRRPRLQSCVLCCALSATGLLALVHVAALRAMHEKPAAQAPYVLAAGETEVHVVFSTDCSPYQHWQSINVWYSARAVGQRGPVTRIASGCAAAEAGKIAAEWLEIDPSGTFRAHFAPAGALRGGTYKYSNKPSGLYHWLTTARPPPFVDSSRGIVVLIDPDQMLLRPITAALGAGLRPSPRKGELVDADGVPRVLGHNLDGIEPRVAPGVAAGQEYGLGGAWGDAGKPTAGKSWRSFDRGRVCGDGPCSRTTVREAAQSYAVGPPYVIHARDAVPLAKAWLRAVPDVHTQYPYLLAEMYAYSMAAANLSLPHAQVHHLMVSNAQAGGEGWDWVDTAPREQICGGAADSTPPLATRFDASLPFSNDVHPPGPAAPAVVHFCQRYPAGGQKFGKHSVPHNAFSCDGGVFAFDAGKAAAAAIGAGSREAVRNAYVLCNVLPRLQAAQLAYKRDVCPKRGLATWNEARTMKA